jgi:hypothetical protein
MRRPDPNAARDRRTVDLRNVFAFVNGSGLPGRWRRALTTTENAVCKGVSMRPSVCGATTHSARSSLPVAMRRPRVCVRVDADQSSGWTNDRSSLHLGREPWTMNLRMASPELGSAQVAMRMSEPSGCDSACMRARRLAWRPARCAGPSRPNWEDRDYAGLRLRAPWRKRIEASPARCVSLCTEPAFGCNGGVRSVAVLPRTQLVDGHGGRTH